LQLVRDGATIVINKDYSMGLGLKDSSDSVKLIMKELLNSTDRNKRILFTPYKDSTFKGLGLEKDVDVLNNDHSIAWTHRKTTDADIYFISNQKHSQQDARLSFRVFGKIPEIWDPITSEISEAKDWEVKNGRTFIFQYMEPDQSLFIIFRKQTAKLKSHSSNSMTIHEIVFLNKWNVQFDKNYGGPSQPVIFDKLKTWPEFSDPSIKYYSGTAIYNNSFYVQMTAKNQIVKMSLESLYNIATIKVNGISCGTLWTQPYTVDITKAVKVGENKIEIIVTNTWHNRLIGDNLLSESKRITWTNSPFRLKDKPLLPAGLTGRIFLEKLTPTQDDENKK
jgi:hypothetical protein